LNYFRRKVVYVPRTSGMIDLCHVDVYGTRAIDPTKITPADKNRTRHHMRRSAGCLSTNSYLVWIAAAAAADADEGETEGIDGRAGYRAMYL
jgi:hypothetical protein